MTACSGIGFCGDPLGVPLAGAVTVWAGGLHIGLTLRGLRGRPWPWWPLGMALAAAGGAVALLISGIFLPPWTSVLGMVGVATVAALAGRAQGPLQGAAQGFLLAAAACIGLLVYALGSMSVGWMLSHGTVGKVLVAGVLALLAGVPSLAWGWTMGARGRPSGWAVAWTTFGALAVFVLHG